MLEPATTRERLAADDRAGLEAMAVQHLGQRLHVRWQRVGLVVAYTVRLAGR
ncbi:MAG: hypothetical protein U1E76_08640 [Planctomycetota bacterium]